MKIERLEMTHYAADGRTSSVERFEHPSWDTIERELCSMHRFSKPIMGLYQLQDVNDNQCMLINGGEDIYHMTVWDDISMMIYFDESRGDEEVEVWTSDQGFTTTAEDTCDTKRALEIVRWYCDHGKPHPYYLWD
jgi:hypothetical protein